MKAWRIYGPLDMRLEETETPVPKENEALIKVTHRGVCGTDIELYDGRMPYIRQGLTKLPIVPGHEWSGVVVEVGKSVTSFKPGDRVVADISLGCGKCRFCLRGMYHICENRMEIGVIGHNGAFAELIVVPEKHIYHIPEGVPLKQAAFTEPAATCLNAIRRTGIEMGDRVVVFGDGVIGFFAAEIALIDGASRVILVARKSEHKKIAESLGLNLLNNKETDIYKEIPKIFGGHLADVTVEATGNPEVLNDAIYLARPGGRISALSITGAEKISVDIDYLVTRDQIMVGSLASPNSFQQTLDLMAAGRIQTDALLSREFPFDEALEAFEYVRLRKGPRIKVQVTGP